MSVMCVCCNRITRQERASKVSVIARLGPNARENMRIIIIMIIIIVKRGEDKSIIIVNLSSK